METKNNNLDIEKKKDNKKKNKFISFLGFIGKLPSVVKIILFVILLVFIFGLGIKCSKTFLHNESVLNFGFNDVGELVTQEWYGTVLEDSTKDRKLFNKYSIPFTKSRIIFSLDVEVTAGLDFNDIDCNIVGNNVKVKLPKAKIYKYYQVPNTFKSYLDDESWFTNINSEERHGLEDEVVEKGKETALNAGILDKADKNAKKVIKQMIKSKNNNYQIDFEEK